ncbi:MAG: hypothetical protein IAG10_07450 [Planctomycetaceae bacterium]|nr:hypothetical protein [Planctomycetaceae bacterium]
MIAIDIMKFGTELHAFVNGHRQFIGGDRCRRSVIVRLISNRYDNVDHMRTIGERTRDRCDVNLGGEVIERVIDFESSVHEKVIRLGRIGLRSHVEQAEHLLSALLVSGIIVKSDHHAVVERFETRVRSIFQPILLSRVSPNAQGIDAIILLGAVVGRREVKRAAGLHVDNIRSQVQPAEFRFAEREHVPIVFDAHQVAGVHEIKAGWAFDKLHLLRIGDHRERVFRIKDSRVRSSGVVSQFMSPHFRNEVRVEQQPIAGHQTESGIVEVLPLQVRMNDREVQIVLQVVAQSAKLRLDRFHNAVWTIRAAF